MNSLLILLSCFAPPIDVEATTLDGESRSGVLSKITSSEAQLLNDEDVTALKRSSLMAIKLTQNTTQRKPSDSLVVSLKDGTVLRCTKFSSESRTISLTSTVAGSIKVPQSQVESVRLAALDRNIRSAWDEVQQKKIRNDVLVVRKGDILDYLTGVVGSIDETSISFLLDDREVSVKREKVFAIIYYGTNTSTSPAPVCEVRATSGEVLSVSELIFDGQQFQATLVSGSKINLEPSTIDNLDFSLGKVRYLSDSIPTDVQFTPYLDYPWQVARDQNTHGTKMKIGRNFYNRGICVHSKTNVVYALNGKYRRFKSITGIDASINPYGKVGLTIRGDDRVLFEKTIAGVTEEGRLAAAEPLDLDVKGVRVLEILVDYGPDEHDFGDNLNFANARFIK